tara:strand:- start:266 stop:520 length:255 start_codon:yes stop_codon:yes gene_type:complete
MIKKFMETEAGVMIVSVVLGFGLATLFQRACKSRDCIIIKAPNPHDVMKNVYRNEDSCYMYKPHLVRCPNKKEMETEETEIIHH